MANPTSIVQIVQTPYGLDDKFYLPFPTNTTTTFVPGELIGLDPATGYGDHFDDTKKMIFWGVFAAPTLVLTSGRDPAPILLTVRRPRYFSYPFQSGTLARSAVAGQVAYAYDSGTITTSKTTYGNVVGQIVDVLTANPEDLTGAASAVLAPAYPDLFSPEDVTNVAATGTVISNAAALISTINIVTAADNAKGVQLPAAIPGRKVTVINAGGGTNTVLKVWPIANSAIDGAGTNNNVTITGVKGTTFYASNTTQWYSLVGA